MQTLATESANSVLAEQGGMILLEGEAVDAVIITNITKTSVTWAAFSGAASYVISVGGGAFTATGISGTTYTGTITIGQVIIVQALDGSGNVIAQGTGSYVPGCGTSFVIAERIRERTRMRRLGLQSR
jgi:hypothetical protein